MRTHDEKLMESSYKKIYVKENTQLSTDEPLLIWLAKRVGRNVPQDYNHRNLLLRLLKNLISNEQKRKKSKQAPIPVSTASVPITPDSFPKSATAPVLSKESMEEKVWNLIKDSVSPEEMARIEPQEMEGTTKSELSDTNTSYSTSDLISQIFQTLIKKHGMRAYETKDVMDLVMELSRTARQDASEDAKIWQK
jgi:hypothetical protein